MHIKRMHNYSVIYPSHMVYAGMMSTYEFAQFSIYTVFATINLWETSTVLPVSKKPLQIHARQLDFMFSLCSFLFSEYELALLSIKTVLKAEANCNFAVNN